MALAGTSTATAQPSLERAIRQGAESIRSAELPGLSSLDQFGDGRIDRPMAAVQFTPLAQNGCSGTRQKVMEAATSLGNRKECSTD